MNETEKKARIRAITDPEVVGNPVFPSDTSATVPLVPLVLHELEMDRVERRERRFFGIIGVLLTLLFVTNGLWLWYEIQFLVTETVTTAEFIADTGDGDGNAIVTNDGGVYNGES